MSIDRVLADCPTHGMTDHFIDGRTWTCVRCDRDLFDAETEWLDAAERVRAGGWDDDDDDPAYREAWWDHLDAQYEAASRPQRRWLP